MVNKSIKIPKIDRFPLPDVMPTEEAIRSFGQNEHAYHPDMWELEYATHQYLNGMTDEALVGRYNDLVRSMCSFISPERGVVPIPSYQGSWYWYRKEHQTRLEFAFRNLTPPSLSICLPKEQFWPPSKTVPNGMDVIFRYGKRQHMREMVSDGHIRFSPAEAYAETGNNSARQDDELRKHAFRSGKYTKITTESGQTLPIVGDIKYTTTGANYHLVCFSCVWDEQLFSEFEADTCVVVTQPEVLACRVEEAGESVFPGLYFHHNPVQYFDPYELRKNEYFEAGMSKNFRFAYQNEYRILWSQMDRLPISGHRFIDIGDARDIMVMYDIEGREVS